MRIYNFVFAKDADEQIAGNLCVPEDSFVRMAGGHEMVPHLVVAGDQIKLTPHPRSVQTVLEVFIETRED
jgi:hypothetical protein